MKRVWISTALILAVALWLGREQQGRRELARQHHEQTLAEARALGIFPADAASSARPGRHATKSARASAADPQQSAEAFARRILSLSRRMKELEQSGQSASPEMVEEIQQALLDLLKIKEEQIAPLLAALREEPGLDAETRGNLLRTCLQIIANHHPEAALARLLDSTSAEDRMNSADHVAATALHHWAVHDPAAALDWLRRHETSHPELVTDETRRQLLAGVARRDPAQAVRLLDELGIQSLPNLASPLADSARTPQERSALLEALRGGEKHAELRTEVLSSMGRHVVAEGFEAATAWLGDAGLDPAEMAAATQFNHAVSGKDTGRWLEWMDGKIPEAAMDKRGGQLVEQWTREDFQAAGAWIQTLPPGRLRDQSLASHAQTLAPHQPEKARQWAMQLPAGPERDRLLEVTRHPPDKP